MRLPQSKSIMHMSALLACAFLLLTLNGCSNSQIEIRGHTMGTSWSVKLADSSLSKKEIELLSNNIEERLAQFNKELSTYDPHSIISQFNQLGSTDNFAITEDLKEAIIAANTISDKTNGLFDITVGPLVNLWGFGPDFTEDKIPTESDISTVQSSIGYSKLSVDVINNTLSKTNPDIYIDASAIAKGQGVDKIAELLSAEGLTNFMVEIGGEVKVSGLNNHAKAWQIAVEKPSTEHRSIQKVIGVSNVGIATSGDYRNFFDINGKQYSHAINPKTGWPVEHDLASVTVISDNTMTADGWATALLIAGADQGMLIANNQQIAALFIVKTADGFEEQTSDTFFDKIEGMIDANQ